MIEPPPLTQFSNKQVTLRFYRQELRLALSQSLFSSFDVDVGSRLLLKTIAQQVPLAEAQSVLDIGCGMGTLALALAKAMPHARVVAQDRDALAVAFTQLNAQKNKVTNVTVLGGLAFMGVHGRFDLIVSNLPGKAGEPVLRHLLAQMGARLSETGRAAVVVVQPLAPFVAHTLAQQGSELLFQEAGKGHTVFHFRGAAAAAETAASETADSLKPYLRTQSPFGCGQEALTLSTVYNLPEFDTLGHHTALTLSSLKGHKIAGDVFIWNPGQGHLPVYVQRQAGARLGSLTLGSRDALSLAISRANLLAQGAEATRLQLQHAAHLLQENGRRFDWLIVYPDIDPGVAWEQLLLPALAERLKENGRLLITTRSAFAFRMLNSKPADLCLAGDRKKQGFRALLYHL